MNKSNDITVYQWWGNDNEPPSHLKTKKQLAHIRLKPVEPVGVIYCTKYDLYLYDPSNPKSATEKRKVTEKQLKALAKGREKQRYEQEYNEWFNNWGHIIKAENEAILRAREIIKDKNNWLILDTETTGLSDAEIVEIGIINLDGEILLNSLVKPSISIPDDATMIHGITNEMVANSPTFPEIYHQIQSITKDKTVGIYNADFDISILNYCYQKHNLQRLEFDYDCIMFLYARYYGEYSDYHGNFKWQPLNGGHRAIDDCLATLKLIKKMADSKVTEDLESLFKKHYTPRDIYLKRRFNNRLLGILDNLKTLEKILDSDNNCSVSEKKIKDYLLRCVENCQKGRSILRQISIKI
ncbi:MAG: 3'-5' exonuclease [Crocosphaera sp.]|nr:3'-5' exonuclease [Crocosphaera sp.]